MLMGEMTWPEGQKKKVMVSALNWWWFRWRVW
jgi:hypothetical protein